ncbi:MAG: SRPBCC domain-containing protein [Phycisphaerales bacterium]|nr:SRPBCC domain-containing protein [Phycisphaerales bacterium]MCB9856534.1 SRPBCC domain-containing protein [Phycisphaerales bacterium]
MSMRSRFVSCLIVFASGSSARSAIHYDLSATDDSNAPVTIDIVVEASPEEVFDLWTSTEGVKEFWVADAIIEPRIGGRYDLLFELPEEAEGPYHFMYQTHILAVECGRSLSFEFRSYRWDRDDRNRGDDFRAIISGGTAGTGITEEAVFRDSWVELRFDSIDGKPGRTSVRLQHYGLSTLLGDAGRKYMELRWSRVLKRLKDCCAECSM